ncbi:hypothetical protein PRIPAC_74954 [Pristionchus pacificus]|uniref:Uncharacterized protein n=1 Tax=Pristionchus pacificus TaxID=54126 RepID=A0A2A6B4Z3_PRIPA|nr:hypothetical protein PRIPAC_74954 [Pristionchus pacificus]|eukprot:PDM60928.1 hypothetical protein PRIPAC_54734 [Pristionchus pacificus]
MRLLLILAAAAVAAVVTQSVAEVKLRKVLDYIRSSGQEKMDKIIANTSNDTQSVAKKIISTIGNSSMKGDEIKNQVVSLYSSASASVQKELDGVYDRLKTVLTSWVQGKKGAGMMWETTTSVPTTTDF